MQKISLIIPTLNEADNIKATLRSLQAFRQHGHEVVVVDGGSHDHTIDMSIPFVDKFLSADSGRALQMNAGAQLANGDILLFLHADTQLPANADKLIIENIKQQSAWGRFDISFTNSRLIFKLIARCINLRSAVSGVATGDQAIFITRPLFDKIGGFPEIPLMEDIAISRLLLKHQRPKRIRSNATTSSRRWETQGIVKTILQMWRLRLLFFFGANPSTLAKKYYPARSKHNN